MAGGWSIVEIVPHVSVGSWLPALGCTDMLAVVRRIVIILSLIPSDTEHPLVRGIRGH